MADANITLRYAIVREGGFGPLVKLLGSGSATAKEEAASTIWQLVSLMNESNVQVTLSPGSAADIVALARGVGVSVRGREAACAVMEQCCVDQTSHSNRETLVNAGAIEAASSVVGAADLPPGTRQRGARALLGLTGAHDRHDSLVSETWSRQVRYQISSVGSLMAEGHVEQEWGAEALRHCEALIEQLAYDVCSVLQAVSSSELHNVGDMVGIQNHGVNDSWVASDGSKDRASEVYTESLKLPIKLALLDCHRKDKDVDAGRGLHSSTFQLNLSRY